MKTRLAKLIKSKYAYAALAAILIAVAACVVFISPSDDVSAETQKAEDSLFAMDTYMTFTVYAEDAEMAINNAKNLITSCEALWSVTDENSEISKLNREGEAKVSDETARLILLALKYRDYTFGSFDPSVYPLVRAWGFTTGEHKLPETDELLILLKLVGSDKITVDGNAVLLSDGSMIDLGGVAKGYVGDLVIESLKRDGAVSALISLGGNIQTIGGKPDGGAWKVGVQSPYGDNLIGVVSVRDKAVITSGAYERNFTVEDGTVYGHIISPFTGKPVANGVVSVTVICKQGSFGDALSTALFVMGKDKAENFWRENSGFDMIMLTDDGTLYVTEGAMPDFTKRDCPEVKKICEIKR